MKKKVVCAVCCLLFALGLSLTGAIFTRGVCGALLDTALSAAAADAEPLFRTASSLLDEYEKNKTGLDVFLDRKEADQLEAAFTRLSLCVQSGDAGTVRGSLREVTVILRVVSDGTLPKKENIF